MSELSRIVAHEPPRRERREIMVVDDSRTTLHMIGRGLGRLGYATVLCQSGSAALDMLGLRSVDLVLLDLVMPELSGVRTLAEVRASPRGADVPVIMMTARSDRAAAIEALEGGADDHLAKPFEFPVLAARIEALLRRVAQLAELRRANAALDARVAERAAESGELRAQLAAVHAERGRLAQSLATLEHELSRLRA